MTRELKNFLKETEEQLMRNDKTWFDVRLIWGAGYKLDIEQFKQLADVDYDPGYGSQEMPADLVIQGTNWLLKRGEYDGAESWDYIEISKPRNLKWTKIPEGAKFIRPLYSTVLLSDNIKAFKLIEKGKEPHVEIHYPRTEKSSG